MADSIIRSGRDHRRVVVALLGALLALSGSLAVSAPAARGATPLKAVIIAGPTGGLTSQNLADSETMARAAEAAGMEVKRIFHPKATWQRVVNNIQGANLVIYMGHGNGWPSPYGPFQEKTKNGFGLNPFEGASASKHEYYGGNPIRSSVRLAPNAVVLLVHLCYASGNAEPGMSIPSYDTARQRVDNYSAAFLAVGARAVFAFSYMQKQNIVGALNGSNKSMDEIFMTAGSGGSNGFIGSRNKRFASERTPGATNHLDPHSSNGYQRAVSGDLSMTAAEWRGGAGGTAGLTTGDTTAPSVPHGLTAEALGYRRIRLSWLPSSDDSGGTIRYRIFRNGNRIKTVTTTEFIDRPESAGWYTYKVRAIDAAGNKSEFSLRVKGQAIKGPR